MTEPEQQNAVVYCRTAQPDNFELKQQEDTCTKFASNNGLNIVKIFNDNGVSGQTLERPGFQSLLEFCKNKQNNIKNIVVMRIDRISRSIADLIDITNTFDQLGIKILSANEKNQTYSSEHFSYNISTEIALFHHKMMSERTKQGMKLAFLKGKWLWCAPYGYKNNKYLKNIVPHNKKRKIVAEIFEKYSTGNYSLHEMSKELSNKKIFKSRYLNKILHNPIYCGYMYKPEWFNNPIKGSFKPIISVELFNKVQDILDNNFKIRERNS